MVKAETTGDASEADVDPTTSDGHLNFAALSQVKFQVAEFDFEPPGVQAALGV